MTFYAIKFKPFHNSDTVMELRFEAASYHDAEMEVRMLLRDSSFSSWLNRMLPCEHETARPN